MIDFTASPEPQQSARLTRTSSQREISAGMKHMGWKRELDALVKDTMAFIETVNKNLPTTSQIVKTPAASQDAGMGRL
jgi:hypothetical protein